MNLEEASNASATSKRGCGGVGEVGEEVHRSWRDQQRLLDVLVRSRLVEMLARGFLSLGFGERRKEEGR